MTNGIYLLIDNYDSFTYNLYQAFSTLGVRLIVRRNDRISIDEIRNMAPDKIIISPGPRTPDLAGISNDIIRIFGQRIPILGICLGHQCIGATFGAVIEKVPEIVHGRTSEIYHDGKGIFKGLPSPFHAARYNSLMISSPPSCLEITARSDDDVIMGIRHKKFPLTGLQFHPESFLTEHGPDIARNFVEMGHEQISASNK